MNAVEISEHYWRRYVLYGTSFVVLHPASEWQRKCDRAL